MNYVSVLPSNHFRTHNRSKREKEDPHQAKGTRERDTVRQARVYRRSSPCPPAFSRRTHTQRKRERRPIPQTEQGKGTPLTHPTPATHPSSSPIHPLSSSSSSANPSFVLRVLRQPTSIDPSLVLTNPSIPHPHWPTFADPFASILFPQDPPPFFSLKI